MGLFAYGGAYGMCEVMWHAARCISLPHHSFALHHWECTFICINTMSFSLLFFLRFHIFVNKFMNNGMSENRLNLQEFNSQYIR